MASTGWYGQAAPALHAGDKPCRIAYFCAEFGLTECFQIYSGGLGGLAGDHLKSAAELGLPLVAVGLLYRKGYFHQYLNPDGYQQEVYPEVDPANQSNVSSVLPNFGFGVFWHSTTYYLGLSAPKLLTNEINSAGDALVTAKEARHYFMIGGLVAPLTQDLRFRPSFMLRAVEGAPLSLDLNAHFLLRERIWFGAMYRVGNSFGVMAQYQVNDQSVDTHRDDYAEGKAALQARVEALQDCIATKVHPLVLDGQPVAGLRYDLGRDPVSGLRGFVAMIDVRALPLGRHQLEVIRPQRKDDDAPTEPAVIPFWR